MRELRHYQNHLFDFLLAILLAYSFGFRRGQFLRRVLMQEAKRIRIAGHVAGRSSSSSLPFEIIWKAPQTARRPLTFGTRSFAHSGMFVLLSMNRNCCSSDHCLRVVQLWSNVSATQHYLCNTRRSLS